MTALGFSGSLLFAVAIGLLLSRLAVPRLRSGAGAALLRLFLAAGLGIGVASCIAFVALMAGAARFLPLIDCALLALLGLAAVALARRGPGAAAPALAEPGPFTRLQGALAVLFALHVAAAAVSLAVTFLQEPHGRWDAWLFWNMHSRFIFRGGDAWRAAFADGMEWSHWDYPLLLPLSTVRSWFYIGAESDLVPALFSVLFAALTVGLLLFSVTILRGRTQGLLAATLLVSTPLFLTMGTAQFADIPLSFFMLATLALLLLAGRQPDRDAGWLILAGAAAGLAAWTKNEGLLFVLIVAATTALPALRAGGRRRSIRRTGLLLLGALPALLTVVAFKAALAPTNDLVAGFGPAAAAARLLDPARWAEIARAFFLTGFSFTQGIVDLRSGMRFDPGAVSILLPAAYLALAGVRVEPGDRGGLFSGVAILLLMLAGYFVVYLLTPLPLDYHLMTSLNRLLLQLWPGALLLCFVVAGGPQEDTPPAQPAPPAPPRNGKPPRRSREKR